MKTLIINGSPRVNGDTASLLKTVKEKMDSEFLEIDAYRCDIAPCIDCRFCWEQNGCAIKDGMQNVYDYIQECDNILIASPIYFSEITGKLLDVGSRLQTYFSAKYIRKEQPIVKPKKGAVILVGGGDGQVDKPYETACTLLRLMNCDDIHEVAYSNNTDKRPAIEDEKVLEKVQSIIDYFEETTQCNYHIPKN